MDYEVEINALKTAYQTQAVQLQQLTDDLAAEVLKRKASFLEAAPVGSIVAYGGSDQPDGWLFCHGQQHTADEFPDLWAAIGTAWGGDRGARTFRVPDLKGVFLRGADRDGSRDPDRGTRVPIHPGGNAGDQVGSFQSDQFRHHAHGVTDPGHSHGYNWLTHTGGPDIAGGIHCARFDDHAYRTTNDSTRISINEAGGAETRPVNAYVNFMIKAKDTVG